MALKKEVIARLQSIVGEDRCKTSIAERYVYAFDGGIHREVPDVVVQPITTQEVAQIVKLANEFKFPVVPRGAGTALCGHSVPIDHGVVVDLQRMKKIKEICVEDLICVVEPGVVCDHLNAALKKYKFFIPGPASSEAATLGGMVACNASGDKALKYGATRDVVLGLEVVLPTGDIARCGARSVKGASGYQFEKFFVGSEGTLGIVTEITLKLVPLATYRAGCVAAFAHIREAGQTVSDIIAVPILPSNMELMSATCIKAVNKATGLGLPEVDAILLIEVDGNNLQAVREELAKVTEVCKKNNAVSMDFSEDPKRLEELWKGRKQMIPSLSALRKEYATVMLADDMSVPISKVPEAVVRFQEVSDRYDIEIPAYGHAGDGNLHTKVLMDPTNPDHWRQADKAVQEIYDIVLELGGTVTGEHGIGITKTPYFRQERASLIAAMKAVKRALDPNNIMNPHKIQEWENGFITHLRYPVEVSQ
ncbi:MAG: FAD-binding protein [Calditrichaeota bacterium]|nr:FAD-binding protein [Calditrichota bacterium]